MQTQRLIKELIEICSRKILIFFPGHIRGKPIEKTPKNKAKVIVKKNASNWLLSLTLDIVIETQIVRRESASW